MTFAPERKAYPGGMRSADTSADAHRVQVSVYRSMTPSRRVAIGAAMSEEAFVVIAAGIRARHPDYDDDQVTWALRRIRVGDDAFREAWPDAPLVAP
jgi:hypothetical protein